MGSPLSPALCLMVVSISEQMWSINFKEILANHKFFARHLRYVDNRFVLAILNPKIYPRMRPCWMKASMANPCKPIILGSEPDQSSWAS